MFTTLISVALFAALSIQGALAEINIQTPKELVQCQEVTLKFENPNKASYAIVAVDPKNACTADLAEVGTSTSGEAKWKVDLPEGTQVQFWIGDEKSDEEGWTGTLTVKGGDASCLKKTTAGVNATANTAKQGSSTLSVAGNAAETHAPPAPSQSDAAQVVGAANSGILGGKNGALSSHAVQLSTVLVGAVAAAFALSY